MKLRFFVVGVAWASFGVASWGQSQNPEPGKGHSKAEDRSGPAATAVQLPLSDDSQVKHDGGKSDVDAVGSRNVGCGLGIGNWFSVERQVAWGRSFAQQVESQVKLVNDPVVTEYVNRIGQNLVRNSDAQVPFTIKVIDSDVVNAMALPGGFFYVNTGLILAADEESEMAAAMAHEIAHVAACHIARERTRSELIRMMTIPAILIGGGIGYGAYEASGIGGTLGILKFSREFEADADYLGIQYMYRSGYDPTALVSFFEKVRAMQKKKAGVLAKTFDTHPQTADRIEKSQDEIRRILPARQQYIATTSEFDEVKARLAAVENKHKLLDEKDGNKPSLRRTSNTTDKSGDTETDPDRPTLKRRDDSSNWKRLELGS